MSSSIVGFVAVVGRRFELHRSVFWKLRYALILAGWNEVNAFLMHFTRGIDCFAALFGLTALTEEAGIVAEAQRILLQDRSEVVKLGDRTNKNDLPNTYQSTLRPLKAVLQSLY